jgi:redox-sensitive bicupin YhaK (pirin superfamily)
MGAPPSRREALLVGGAALAACVRAPTPERVVSARGIRLRTRGSRHGFIRRMVSPGDLGEAIKPFVFLDQIKGEVRPGMGFPFHPHSGIATLTYVRDADGTYEDTTGKSGVLRAGGLEWMMSGGGVWHRGGVLPNTTHLHGFQLWVAMPPSHEEAPAESHYIPPEEVPLVENVRVLLGGYGGRRSPVPAPASMTYLDAHLRDGERWTYTPPADHRTAWCFVHEGTARVAGTELTDTLAVFDEGDGAITFEARGETRVLIGSAAPHGHPLVLGTSSVHTDMAALERSLGRIREIGAGLRREGRV